MKKQKELSRRKKVKFIHDVKNLSYKESRELLKANGYDIFKALGLNFASDIIKSITDGVSRAIDNMIEAFTNLADSIAKYI